MNIENIKIRVHGEAENKAVQNKLFKLGASWSTDSEGQTAKYYDSTGIFVSSDGDMTRSTSDESSYFNDHINREVTIKALLGGKYKFTSENLTRYMAYGMGCDNKGTLFKLEKTMKEDLKRCVTNSDWSGRIVGYKLIPLYEAETSVRLKKINR